MIKWQCTHQKHEGACDNKSGAASLYPLWVGEEECKQTFWVHKDFTLEVQLCTSMTRNNELIN